MSRTLSKRRVARRPGLFAAFALSLIAFSPLVGQDAATEETAEAAPQEDANAGKASASDEQTDAVEGTAKEWDEDPSTGVRILTGDVRIKRLDGTGHVYADKVTMYYDPDGDSRKVDNMIAEGNVNLREGDIYATCDKADFTEGTAVIDMTGSVVVLQDDGRMEGERFKYDRRTGRRQAWGGVKFRFELPRETAAPDASAADETADEGARTTIEDADSTDENADAGTED